MTTEREPAKQPGDETDVEPPWMGAASLRFGHARLTKIAESVLAATAGFAIGSFAHLPNAAKFGTVGVLLVVSATLSLIAQRTLSRAVELQKNAIASMNIKDLAVVDLTTGKVTPPDPQREIPTEPAPAPTKE